MSDTPHYLGHRERLKQRFKESAGHALLDYELMELLLTYIIPRRDTKPLAKALLNRFGSFAAVMEASADELKTVEGVGEGVITFLQVLAASNLRARKSKVVGKKVMEDKLDLLDYLYTKVSALKHEEFHIIYLDTKNNVLADDMLFRGTLNESAVYPREVVRAALSKGAASLVLVHNHPSGDPTPSYADEAITMQIVSAAAAVGITVHDHIIIGKERHYSFYDHGRM